LEIPGLLIVGSHGRSRVARLFLGSVSLELLHKASCSVRVARSGGPSTSSHPIRIVIGYDGSLAAQAVIRSIAARSWPMKTEAEIISAVQTLVPGTAATALEASTYAQELAYSVIREADERERARLRNVAGDSANSLRQTGLIATSAVRRRSTRSDSHSSRSLSGGCNFHWCAGSRPDGPSSTWQRVYLYRYACPLQRGSRATGSLTWWV
jgi:hypothetical protein